MKKLFVLLCSHIVVFGCGFGLGIYALPNLIAQRMPVTDLAATKVDKPLFTGQFVRNLEDSDFLHWGEGKVTISATQFTLEGRLAPGPNYKLYFSPRFVETEAEFNQYKSQMVVAADIMRFENVTVDLHKSVDPTAFNSVIIWCEAFGEFITAARYTAIGQ